MELLLAAAKQESNLPVVIGWGTMGLVAIGILYLLFGEPK